MTATQEIFTDTTRRGQDATISALETWADSLKKMVGSMTTSDGKIPSAAEVVDNYFDFVEHMLATQREFAKSLMAVTTSATTSAVSAAQGAAKNSTSKKS